MYYMINSIEAYIHYIMSVCELSKGSKGEKGVLTLRPKEPKVEARRADSGGGRMLQAPPAESWAEPQLFNDFAVFPAAYLLHY